MSVFDEEIEICWDILKFFQQILNFSSHPSTLQPRAEGSAELHHKSEGQVWEEVTNSDAIGIFSK